MCEPTTLALISIGLTAASGVAGYQMQSKAAKQQEASIRADEALQQNDLARQRDQQHEAAAAQMNEQARAAQREMALFDVVSGEYGGGNTDTRGRAVASLQDSEQLATLADNAQTAFGENSFASMASSSRAQSRIAGIQRPSAFGTALQIGAAGLNAYAGMPTAGAGSASSPNSGAFAIHRTNRSIAD
jgi:hypothetical protein